MFFNRGDKYERGVLLGAGSYGKVYRVEKDGFSMVEKVLKNSHIQPRYIQNEVKLMRKMGEKSRHVARLYDAFASNNEQFSKKI